MPGAGKLHIGVCCRQQIARQVSAWSQGRWQYQGGIPPCSDKQWRGHQLLKAFQLRSWRNHIQLLLKAGPPRCSCSETHARDWKLTVWRTWHKQHEPHIEFAWWGCCCLFVVVLNSTQASYQNSRALLQIPAMYVCNWCDNPMQLALTQDSVNFLPLKSQVWAFQYSMVCWRYPHRLWHCSRQAFVIWWGPLYHSNHTMRLVNMLLTVSSCTLSIAATIFLPAFACCMRL